MVKIRLSLVGAKKRPFYHIVVTDIRNARNGIFLERLGFFNPMKITSNNTACIDMNRFSYWISKGAQISPRVLNIVKFVKTKCK